MHLCVCIESMIAIPLSQGWLDEKKVAMETMMCFKRAGG
jgi:delta-aminolevulinic acid dehydratase/porphobilinogen synthase